MPSRRVVLVMLEPPVPFGNAGARWFNVLLKGLVGRGHRVTAFAACSKPAEIDQARALFPAPEYDLRLYPFPAAGRLASKWRTLRRPYSYMFSEEFRRDLAAELSKGYDILHLEQLWCSWLALDRPETTLVNVHFLAGIDLRESKPEGWRGRLEQTLMFRTERFLIREMTHFRSLSDRMVGPILAINPEARVSVVPIGLDPDRYPFIPDDRRDGTPVLGLIGTMNWYPSYSAAVRLLTRLWPEIKCRVPGARLQIVGWSARTALRDYLDTPDVEIIEDVPDTRPYFERTGVLLYAPSRGTGMKIKILEAMGFGIPVVTTSEGVEGIPAVDGVHAGIAEDDPGLIERTVALLLDRDRQNRQRLAARQLLEAHCGPGPTLDGIESLYDRMIEARR